MMYTTHRHLITGSLIDTVREALKEVPPDAHGLIVIVNSDKPLPEASECLVEVDHKQYPVRVDPTFNISPPNTVYIGYGQGVLE